MFTWKIWQLVVKTHPQPTVSPFDKRNIWLAYEEEFDCRDFRWSPDSKHIGYWQIDANTIRNFWW
jgi:hypothetical protein